MMNIYFLNLSKICVKCILRLNKDIPLVDFWVVYFSGWKFQCITKIHGKELEYHDKVTAGA